MLVSQAQAKTGAGTKYSKGILLSFRLNLVDGEEVVVCRDAHATLGIAFVQWSLA